MASTTINNIRFVYPDSPCFVFNPVPVRALPVGQGVSLDRLRLEMTGSGGDSFEVTYSMRYTATVDISEYLQGLYTGMLMGADIDYTSQSGYSEMGQSVTIVAKALNAAGTVIAQCTFTLFTIWGGLKAGEIFNQHRTVTWFKNYPFTIGYYADQAQYVAAGVNSSPATIMQLNNQGLYNILIDDAMGGQYMTFYDVIGSLAQTSFENMFDLTFYYTLDGIQVEKVRVRLVSENINEGIYLRWIDRHGFWNYYLFKEGNVTRNVASDGLWHRNDLGLWEPIYHWQQSTGRRQNLTRNDVLPVCAPLVDQETFDMLQDVTTSPCVDMYLGKDENDEPKWTAVTIEAGQYTKDVKKPEQDFIMNIVLPEIPIQQL